MGRITLYLRQHDRADASQRVNTIILHTEKTSLMSSPWPLLLLQSTLKPVGLEIGSQSVGAEHLVTWQQLLASVLTLAFHDRAVCLLAPATEEDSWDLNLRELIPDCEVRRFGEYYYHCAFLPGLSPHLCQAVATSHALYLSPIWLTHLLPSDVDRLEQLMRAKFNAGLQDHPQTPEEFLYTNPDGDWLYWLNPGQPTNVIVPKLHSQAQAAGWQIASPRPIKE